MYPNKMLFTINEMLAGLAHWAVRQDPYMCPPELNEVLLAWDDQIRPDFVKFIPKDEPRLQMGEFTFDELKELISRLHRIPEFKDWNLSRNERERGIKVDDPSRAPFAFTSRYGGGPTPDNDFIDLDALTQNLVRFLWHQAESERADGDRIMQEVREGRATTREE